MDQQVILKLEKEPELLLLPNKEISRNCFDISKIAIEKANKVRKLGKLSELYGEDEGFVLATQVWELLQLRNQSVIGYAANLINKLEKEQLKSLERLAEKQKLKSDEKDQDEEEDEDDDENDMSEEEDVENEDEDEEQEDEEEEEKEENMDDEELDSETFSDLDGEGEYETSATNKRKNKSGESETKRSVVDDDFFSLDQMHKFTEQAEMLEEKRLGMLNDDENQEDDEENEDEDEGESEIDYFEDDAGDDDGFDASKIKYGDFFKPPTLAGSSKGVVRSTTESKKRKAESVEKTVEEEEEEEKEEGGEQSNMSDDEGKGKEDEDGNDIEEHKRKRVRFEQNDEGEDDEEEEDSKNDDRNKSEFEKYTDQMGKRIKTLEQQLVAKKDWTMIGEVNSKMRPVNSLLEEHLEYDYVQKPVPVITQTVTEALEDMIKNRIVEQQFDDVERKKATQQTERSSSNKEDFELLDENKPKQSLAQVYEEEYKQQQQQKSGTKAAHKDAALHAEIEALYSKLAYTLDSLSNFQYTPKMVSPNTTDPSIRPDQPAIEMEEALPILVSEANRMAPKEVYSGIKGIKKTDDISSDGKSAPTAPVIPSNNVIHGKGTGILISSTEASKADRRRWRAAKKKAKAAANADKKPKSKPEPESKPKPKSQ